MKKIYQRLWNILLILLLLCAGVYILFLRDTCNSLKDTCRVQSRQRTGYIYRDILKWFKDEHGKYPDSIEELVPDYLPSLYDWRLGYFSDPYYSGAIRKYWKENGESPDSLEALVPKYLSDLSDANWSYIYNANDCSFEMILTFETASNSHCMSVDPNGVMSISVTSL